MPTQVAGWIGLPYFGSRPFAGAASGDFPAQVLGNAVGHSVQPAGGAVEFPNRAGLASQDQESGLAGVLGILMMAENSPANAKDHRPVPLDERGGSLFIPPVDEALQQFSIG